MSSRMSMTYHTLPEMSGWHARPSTLFAAASRGERTVVGAPCHIHETSQSQPSQERGWIVMFQRRSYGRRVTESRTLVCSSR